MKSTKDVKVRMFEHKFVKRVVVVGVMGNEKDGYEVAIAVKDPTDKYSSDFVQSLIVNRLERKRKNGSYLKVTLDKMLKSIDKKVVDSVLFSILSGKKTKNEAMSVILDKYTKIISERAAVNAYKRSRNKQKATTNNIYGLDQGVSVTDFSDLAKLYFGNSFIG